MTTRRKLVLAVGGAGFALIAGGGVWRVTRLPRTATAPWALGPPPADARLDAFRHAILAPNPHNRQPWLIHLTGRDGADLSCDLARRLPETDPFDRQMTIGFGAFLELARIAAAQRGLRLDVEAFPAGDPGPRLTAAPVARLRFAADPATPRDPLFAAIPHRRSTKEPYDLTRPVTSAQLAALIAAEPGVVFGSTSNVAALQRLIVDALTLEMQLPRTNQESIDLIRIGHAEIDAAPDGIDLSGPMIEALAIAGQLDRGKLADPASLAFKSGLEQQRAVYGSIPALLWIATPGNSRADQLAAGRAYVRANLRATAMGLAMHPTSQSLQEYPEMAGHLAALHRQLGVAAPARVQMLARVGHGPKVAPSPRWPLAARLA